MYKKRKAKSDLFSPGRSDVKSAMASEQAWPLRAKKNGEMLIIMNQSVETQNQHKVGISPYN